VGLVAAYLLGHVFRAVLRLTKLDRVSEDAGASRVLRMADLPSMTELLSRSIFWITWLGFILIGISVLGVAGLQEQISRLFRFLPEVFIAMLILFLGLVLANFLSRAALLASVNAGVRSPKIWSWSIRFVIWILAISWRWMNGAGAADGAGAFSIVFGASMLGLAIAFGLEDRIWRGGRWRDISEIRPRRNTKSRNRCNALDGKKCLWPCRVLSNNSFLI
jgi:hypothetical protein